MQFYSVTVYAHLQTVNVIEIVTLTALLDIVPPVISPQGMLGVVAQDMTLNR